MSYFGVEKIAENNNIEYCNYSLIYYKEECCFWKEKLSIKKSRFWLWNRIIKKKCNKFKNGKITQKNISNSKKKSKKIYIFKNNHKNRQANFQSSKLGTKFSAKIKNWIFKTKIKAIISAKFLYIIL